MNVYNQAVPAAGTYTTDPFLFGVRDKDYVAIQGALTYGSGGTSIDVYLQTTFDDGLTWRDMANLNFLLASANKASAICSNIAAAAAIALTDGTLAANTINQGLIGNKFRLKIIIVGTYATSTLRIDVESQDSN